MSVSTSQFIPLTQTFNFQEKSIFLFSQCESCLWDPHYGVWYWRDQEEVDQVYTFVQLIV